MFMPARCFTPTVALEDVFVPPRLDLGQFFYSAATAADLARRLEGYAAPCCLCTPRLARAFADRGRVVRLLDMDDRFAALAGYRRFDLERPAAPRESYDMVFFDPVFIAARILRRALDVVAGAPDAADAPTLYMAFPRSREAELLAGFAAWRLAPLDYELRYNNILPEYFAAIGLYGNRPLPP